MKGEPHDLEILGGIEPDDTSDASARDMYRKARSAVTGKLSDLTRIMDALSTVD